MEKSFEEILELAKDIKNDTYIPYIPPPEGGTPTQERIIPFSVVSKTRGYIEKVTNQINGTFENGWYDGCAVMIRRLVETLIIEVYEYHSIDSEIKNGNGDFYYLNDLIDKIVNQPQWNLSRNAKRALGKLKDVGDKSAHSRRYNAHLNDLDNIKDDVRLVTQELIYLAGLK